MLAEELYVDVLIGTIHILVLQTLCYAVNLNHREESSITSAWH